MKKTNTSVRDHGGAGGDNGDKRRDGRIIWQAFQQEAKITNEARDPSAAGTGGGGSDSCGVQMLGFG